MSDEERRGVETARADLIIEIGYDSPAIDDFEKAVLAEVRACRCDYEVNSYDIGCPLHGASALYAARQAERCALATAALVRLLDSWDAVVPELNALTGIAYVHGHVYNGPTMVDALAEARAALVTLSEG